MDNMRRKATGSHAMSVASANLQDSPKEPERFPVAEPPTVRRDVGIWATRFFSDIPALLSMHFLSSSCSNLVSELGADGGIEEHS